MTKALTFNCIYDVHNAPTIAFTTAQMEELIDFVNESESAAGERFLGA